MASTANIVFSQVGGGRVLVRLTANASINVIANSLGQCDISNPVLGGVNTGANVVGDPITGVNITGIWWSLASPATIARASNTVLKLNGTDHWTRGEGFPAETEFQNAATVVVTFNDTNSMMILELTKIYAGGSPPDASAH